MGAWSCSHKAIREVPSTVQSSTRTTTKKTTRHTKKGKIMAHSKGKSKSTETVPEKGKRVALI